MNTDLKTCLGCGIDLLLVEYSRNKNNKDGLQSHCKICNAQYRQNHHDEIIKGKKNYSLRNKGKIKAGNKRYRQDNKEEIAAMNKRYRQKNRAWLNVQAKQYYKKNKIKLLAYAGQYNKTEKGKSVDSRAKHKRRVLKHGGVYEIFDKKEIFERDGYICQHCRKKTRPDFKNSYHSLYPNLDHILPLSKGGDHTRLNTQCLCRQCNVEKGSNGTGDQLRMFG